MSKIPRTFTLHVIPEDLGRYRLDLDVTSNGTATTVARLDGKRLDRLRPTVVQAVTSSGHQRTVLSPTRRTPIHLTEDAGVRLSLIAMATAPLAKPARVEAIRLGLAGVSSEEALYWYAHCVGPNRNRAVRALRTLFSDE